YLAREYDPATGRFNSPDPAREGFSPYVYVGNNPINFVDPDGKMKTYITGSYIGYTESSSNIGKPSLYFTRGHLTQAHSFADNIGWHPIKEGETLNCINLTRRQSEWFKGRSYYQQLMFCMDIIRDDSYQEELDTSNLLEFSSKNGDVFDLHHSRSKLVRVGDPEFKPEYNQNYAEEAIKSAKIAGNVNENVNEATLKYSTSNADHYRDFGMRRGQVLELANYVPGERIGEGARVRLPRIE
ncbi:RHS repeat-associated core domain-containing protein, partial [Propionigenium maris]|uniref:RHS repeat-associated core domain-containing protein n=1 Tax=Propionigenium maris TaxID=45622 RepID=UPI002490FB22